MHRTVRVKIRGTLLDSEAKKIKVKIQENKWSTIPISKQECQNGNKGNREEVNEVIQEKFSRTER